MTATITRLLGLEVSSPSTDKVRRAFRASVRQPDAADIIEALEIVSIECNAIARDIRSRALSGKWSPEFLAIFAKAKARAAFDEALAVIDGAIPQTPSTPSALTYEA